MPQFFNTMPRPRAPLGRDAILASVDRSVRDAVSDLLREVDSAGSLEEAEALQELIDQYTSLFLRLTDRSLRHIEFLEVRV